jgi:hypothetical protein
MRPSICRSGVTSSWIQNDRPWVATIRSLSCTTRYRIDVTGMPRRSDCQCAPSSNDTYVPRRKATAHDILVTASTRGGRRLGAPVLRSAVLDVCVTRVCGPGGDRRLQTAPPAGFAALSSRQRLLPRVSRRSPCRKVGERSGCASPPMRWPHRPSTTAAEHRLPHRAAAVPARVAVGRSSGPISTAVPPSRAWRTPHGAIGIPYPIWRP